MSLLSKLPASTTKKLKRVGRGFGSTRGGHTSGRGMKGQLSRTGANVPLWFEGGQLPLIKRVPMLRGKGRLVSFNKTAEVTLSELESMKADTISLDTLKVEGMISKRAKAAKVIATGSISRKVALVGLSATAGAQKSIEKAGGSVTK